ncbi:MAG: cupredoxin domain-containing protein [Acidimicrobiales bacterium]
MRTSRLLAAAVPLALVVTGCGGGSSKKATTVAPNTILIQGFAFSPTSVTVHPGVTVTVRNVDGTDHTVSSDDKTSFDTKHVSGGNSTTFTAPTKTGKYAYHCNVHNYMTATLIVQ